MINVSNAFMEELNNDNRNFLYYVDLILKDNTKLSLDNSKIWDGGVSFDEAVSSDNTFDIGSAIINKLQLTINNMYDEFSAYDFGGATVTVSIGLKLSNGTIEKIRKGVYTVYEMPKYNGAIITLECLDNMKCFDQDYSLSKLTYPATVFQIMQDACTVCNVSLGSASIPNGNYVVQERPEDKALTFRQVLLWVAQICGCWAKVDSYGKLLLQNYDLETYEHSNLNGGTFMPWNKGDAADGGSFSPWKNETKIEGGTFSDFKKFHHISSISSKNISTDDVVITGIKVKEYSPDAEVEAGEYISGNAGYILCVEDNKLIPVGKGEEVVTYLGKRFIGLRFRPLTVGCLSDPTIEAGDIAYITDEKSNTYRTLITNSKYTAGSYQNISCGAESAERNSASRYSRETQAVVETRKMVKKERSDREKALEDLKNTLETSSGLYSTIQKQGDGSNIYYFHDKPTLAESKTVWKMTAEAWAVSTDGGKTWNGGMTMDGDAITRILSAVGVNADWIRSGSISVKKKDGTEAFYADKDTGAVRMQPDSFLLAGKTIPQITSENSCRSFVTQPVPPYSIGDVWMTGKEILTCTKPRTDKEAYVASDWSKKDSYTDDTVAKQALDEAKKMRALSIQLQNEYHSVPTDANGNNGNYTGCETAVYVLWGQSDVSAAATYSVSKSTGVTGTWNASLRKYTVTALSTDTGYVDITASYLGVSTTSRFSISKNKQGEKGVQGPKGSDGKQYYTWLKYADTPTSGMSDNPAGKAYIGLAYNKTTATESSNYSDYTWSLTKGEKGDQGVPGGKGSDGKTYYTWVKYATNASGANMSDSPAGKTYIGLAYNKATATESTVASDYTWSLIKGDKGDAGRTYFIDASTVIIKKGQNGSLAPKTATFSAYYRDGSSAARTAYAGRFIISESTDGSTWVNKYTSSANESSKTYTPTSAAVNVRCTLYAAGGTSTALDIQTIAIVVDVSSLTQEIVFNKLTNNGALKGIYMQDSELYINFSYGRGGTLKLGGLNNTNGLLDVYDASGNRIGHIDNAGTELLGNFKNRYKYFQFVIETNLANGSLTMKKDNFTFFKLDTSEMVYSDEYDGDVINVHSSGVGVSFLTSTGGASINGKVYISGDFYASGSKSRIIETDNYDVVAQYCYEMASPMFGDIGSGSLDETGECTIWIDEIFSETINADNEYYVFLQKEGPGDIWVAEKKNYYFIVKGTKKLKFSWEVKAKQKNYEYERLENVNLADDYKEKNYESIAANMVRSYCEELEESRYEKID